MSLKNRSSILNAIQQFGNFSNDELHAFQNKCFDLQLQKNDFLLEENQVSQTVYFIENGTFRSYFLNKENEENTTGLFIGKDWVFDMQSFTSQKPSRNFIQATENSSVIGIHMESVHELITQSQQFFALGKILELNASENLFNPQGTPEEKYKSLLQKKPALILKFPLKFIASYLGITPETLSRVRKRIN